MTDDPLAGTPPTPQPTIPPPVAPASFPPPAATLPQEPLPGTPMYAPAVAVPVQPVKSGPVTGRRTHRTRWVVAGLVTLLVLTATAGAFALLAAGAPTSNLVGYVPANSIAYAELRLDAPGDQRQQAANFLSHFPGFADQASLNTKLDEALDQLVGQATSGKQTFTGDLKLWLGDALAVAAPRAPSSAKDKAGLVIVSTRDAAAANAWAESTLGTSSGTETYGGVALTTVSKNGSTLEYGTVGQVLLFGDPTSVHAAIDTKGTSGFADSASFKAAVASTPGDRVAFGYLDIKTLTQSIDLSRVTKAAELPLDRLPAWLAVTVQIQSDAVLATVTAPQTDLAPNLTNHASVLATRLPANTIAAGEIHDMAQIAKSLTAAMAAAPSASPGSSDAGAGSPLDLVGGLDGLVGWIGDGTVAITKTDDALGVSGGVIIQATDAKTASDKFIQIKNLITLAGGQAGITSTDETYNGTTITLVDVGSLAQLAAGAAGSGPAAGALGSLGDLKIAIAQKDDLVIAGLGDSFVKGVLDTKPGSSLADQANYRTALEKVGASNAGQYFLDVQALADVIVKHLPADKAAEFQEEYAPYLAPVQAYAFAGTAGDPLRLRIVVTVK